MLTSGLNHLCCSYKSMDEPVTCCFVEMIQQMPVIFCGTRNGKMYVFINGTSQPCKQMQISGGIPVVITQGDILNSGERYLVVITVEGNLSCYPLEKFVMPAGGSPKRVEFRIGASAGKNTVAPVYTQYMQANVIAAFVADVDTDGKMELVVGMSDRVVRTYRYHVTGGSPARSIDKYDLEFSGHLCAISKWEVPCQITGLSLGRDRFGVGKLLICQPDCRYITINLSSAARNDAKAMETAIDLKEIKCRLPEASGVPNPGSGINSIERAGELDVPPKEYFVTFQKPEFVTVFHPSSTSLVLVELEGGSGEKLVDFEAPIFQAFPFSMDGMAFLAVTDWYGHVFVLKTDGTNANGELMGELLHVNFDIPTVAFAIIPYSKSEIFIACCSTYYELSTAIISIEKLVNP